jgi:tRNA(fMet)-specific endonuclease VapC
VREEKVPKYILDTDICIYWLKGDKRIENRIIAVDLQNIFITIITECELFYGAYKSSMIDKNLEALKALREKIKTIQTSPDVGPLYGRIKADLEEKGQMLDDADLLIACIALASKGILVTNNAGHFKRISGLQIENWR